MVFNLPLKGGLSLGVKNGPTSSGQSSTDKLSFRKGQPARNRMATAWGDQGVQCIDIKTQMNLRGRTKGEVIELHFSRIPDRLNKVKSHLHNRFDAVELNVAHTEVWDV